MAIALQEGMKTAFSVLDQRIAPVFDTSRTVLFVESAGGQDSAKDGLRTLIGENAQQRISWFSEQQVDVLVCGAISKPIQMCLEAVGIQVISFVAGDIDDVVTAFTKGLIGDYAFTMPGCCGRRRGWRGREGGCRRRQENI